MSQRLLPVDLHAQSVSVSFAHAPHHLIDTLDLSAFDAHFNMIADFISRSRDASASGFGQVSTLLDKTVGGMQSDTNSIAASSSQINKESI